MENTLENKAKFFALYWGLIVAKITKGSYTHPLDTIHVVDKNVLSSVESENYVKHKYSLELTPISSISDDDAIEVTKILKYKEDDYFVKNFGFESFEYLKDEIKEAKHGFIGHIVNESSRVLSVADYLRSKGYYIGDGTEIDYGWVKLKEQIK